MAETVRIDGLKELGESLKGLRLDMAQKAARQAVAAGASVVRAAARKTTAFKDKSGALRKGIVMKRVNRSSLTSEFQVGISTKEMVKYVKNSRDAREELQGPIMPVYVNGKLKRAKKLIRIKDQYESFGDLYYFRFLEFGTVKMPARPFIAPALSQNIQKATEAIKKRLGERIEKYKGIK
jgi:HK97 gp10 family phage protein